MQPGLEDRQDSAPGAKVELIDACLRKGAFSPHRHDTYTIALTTAGVQSFNYRGGSWRSLPGQVMILHPDEVHDGYCCDEAGFSYRAAYLRPAEVQTVIGGAPLPFLANSVSDDPALVGAARRFAAICAAEDEPLGFEDALHQLVAAMLGCTGQTQARRTMKSAISSLPMMIMIEQASSSRRTSFSVASTMTWLPSSPTPAEIDRRVSGGAMSTCS